MPVPLITKLIAFGRAPRAPLPSEDAGHTVRVTEPRHHQSGPLVDRMLRRDVLEPGAALAATSDVRDDVPAAAAICGSDLSVRRLAAAH